MAEVALKLCNHSAVIGRHYNIFRETVYALHAKDIKLECVQEANQNVWSNCTGL